MKLFTFLRLSHLKQQHVCPRRENKAYRAMGVLKEQKKSINNNTELQGQNQPLDVINKRRELNNCHICDMLQNIFF